jgi:hypothetical protein
MEPVRQTISTRCEIPQLWSFVGLAFLEQKKAP